MFPFSLLYSLHWLPSAWRLKSALLSPYRCQSSSPPGSSGPLPGHTQVPDPATWSCSPTRDTPRAFLPPAFRCSLCPGCLSSFCILPGSVNWPLEGLPNFTSPSCKRNTVSLLPRMLVSLAGSPSHVKTMICLHTCAWLRAG